jgi:hypothetical protein
VLGSAVPLARGAVSLFGKLPIDFVLGDTGATDGKRDYFHLVAMLTERSQSGWWLFRDRNSDFHGAHADDAPIRSFV